MSRPSLSIRRKRSRSPPKRRITIAHPTSRISPSRILFQRSPNEEFNHSDSSVSSASSTPKPTLLTLPREIRDIIIDHVLTTPTSAPLSPSETFHQRRPLHGANTPNVYGWPARSVLALPPETAMLSLPGNCLRLASRQLNVETLAAMERVSARKQLRYVFDVMFVRDFGLWPTCLQWPGPPRGMQGMVDSVEVQVRYFDPPEDVLASERARWWKISSVSHENGSYLNWTVYFFILSLLRHGPSLAGTRYMETFGTPTLTIRSLTFNTLTMPAPPDLLLGTHPVDQEPLLFSRDWGDSLVPWSSFPWAPSEDKSPSHVHADKLAFFLAKTVRDVLRCYSLPEAQALYDNVGAVVFQVNGHARKEMDLHDPDTGPEEVVEGVAQRAWERMGWFREWRYVTRVTRWRHCLVDEKPTRVDGVTEAF